jgi:hypothetical protein
MNWHFVRAGDPTDRGLKLRVGAELAILRNDSIRHQRRRSWRSYWLFDRLRRQLYRISD